MSAAPRPEYGEHWPHRCAVLLCCATFPLIWVGGLVTTYDAGMAVPDWPSTYGYNLFLYPWTTWISGPWDLFVEHGHRLLGALVGMITIALVVLVWWKDGRQWMRGLAVLALLLVIAQGMLGGARVLLDDRLLAMLHACLGPAFFAFSAALAVCTSPLWHAAARPDRQSDSRPAVRLRHLSLITAGLAYAQLVLGAQLRHIPVMASAATFRWAVVFHLLMAGILAGHVVALNWAARRAPRADILSRPARVLLVLLVLQFVLGPATWVVNYGWPTWVPEWSWTAGYVLQAKSFSSAMVVTAHVATGSLVIATAVLLTVRAFRVLRPAVVVGGLWVGGTT